MLTGKQRAELRAAANSYETLFQIGKGGITANLIEQTDTALNAREMIKLRCLETAGISPRAAADTIAEACGAEVVQVIGSKLVLYRPAADPKDRVLLVPAPKKATPSRTADKPNGKSKASKKPYYTDAKKVGSRTAKKSGTARKPAQKRTYAKKSR